MQDFYTKTIRVCESATPANKALFQLSLMDLSFLKKNSAFLEWGTWW